MFYAMFMLIRPGDSLMLSGRAGYTARELLLSTAFNAHMAWYPDVIHILLRLGMDDIHSRMGVGVASDAVRHVSL